MKKITMYELLDMIKNKKAPKRVIIANKVCNLKGKKYDNELLNDIIEFTFKKREIEVLDD